MKILVACEYSGRVRDAFALLGHDVTSCDFEPTESPGKHYRGDVRDILYSDWDLIIAHPPCTYLANSGVRWLIDGKGQLITERYKQMIEAVDFFNLFLRHPCKKIMVENPIQHKHARKLLHAPYSQVIQPWHFGHKEMKATCLWLKGLPQLLSTDVVGPPPKDKAERRKWAKVHLASPSPTRWKDRSRTYTGIAEAMALQWGQ